jgi:hypothetical protein
MKRLGTILCLIAVCSVVKGQISMETNLPGVVAVNTDLSFEIRIHKGNTANFAKYQMEVPEGVTVKEEDSKSGSFTFEDQLVKIIWVMAPADPELRIRFSMNTGSQTGQKHFVQKYFYVENDDKKEAEMEPFLVQFSEGPVEEIPLSEREFTRVTAKSAPSLLTTIDTSDLSTKNPEVIKQQVFQLRKDARDAFEVGEREKRKAMLNIEAAGKAIEAAEAISDEGEREQALEKAKKQKLKAENDLEIASRVLVLAKSLNDNADEIETINRSLHPASYADQPAIATSNQRRAGEPEGVFTTVDMSEEEVRPATRTRARQKEPTEDNTQETGLVFKIQLGAFSKQPSRSDFKALGKVVINRENGMYKVLYGSYSSKEEAMKQREFILGKGFDGFVVAYQDGIRLK